MSDRLWLAEKPDVTGTLARVVQVASTVERLRDDGWTVYGPFVAEVALKGVVEVISEIQGEAYLGTLAGDEGIEPLTACENVIAACLDALDRLRGQ